MTPSIRTPEWAHETLTRDFGHDAVSALETYIDNRIDVKRPWHVGLMGWAVAGLVTGMLFFGFPGEAKALDIPCQFTQTDASAKAGLGKQYPQSLQYLFNGESYTKFMAAAAAVTGEPVLEAAVDPNVANEAWVGVREDVDPGVGVVLLAGDCYQGLSFHLTREALARVLTLAWPKTQGSEFIWQQPHADIPI